MCKSIQCIVGITEPAALQLQADLQAAGCKILCNVAKHDAYCQEIPERSPRNDWNTGLQIELAHGTRIKITCPQAPCIFKHRFNKNMTQMWVGYEKSWSIWANTLDLVHLGTLQ